MHAIEPYWRWRGVYTAETDPQSPFYQRQYSEFEFTNAVYDHVIHPQWDEFESQTLYTKILYADYQNEFAILECMGEWNDLLYNDIMFFKRNVINPLIDEGILHFIIIGENVLNYHSSDDSYYEEWFDDVEHGWIAMVNFLPHVESDFLAANIDHYIMMGPELNEVPWRTMKPDQLYKMIGNTVDKRIG